MVGCGIIIAAGVGVIGGVGVCAFRWRPRTTRMAMVFFIELLDADKGAGCVGGLESSSPEGRQGGESRSIGQSP